MVDWHWARIRIHLRLHVLLPHIEHDDVCTCTCGHIALIHKNRGRNQRGGTACETASGPCPFKCTRFQCTGYRRDLFP